MDLTPYAPGEAPGNPAAVDVRDIAAWTIDTCMTCRGQAWRAPDGDVFCPDCEDKATRLRMALASVACPPVYLSLKSALLGTTAKSRPQMVPFS